MVNNEELLIGAHTSAAGGAYKALLEGQSIGATTIQLFTANQRRWDSKALAPHDIEMWHRTLLETGLKQIMSHDSYLINLGAPDAENLHKSRKAFREEIVRCHQLKIDFLNFHPGAAIKEAPERCLDLIVESLLELESEVAAGETRLLLEATAGQGSALGWRFEHLDYIISRVENRIPIGVCIDTCHIFVAGYDIRSPKAWNATLEEFDRVVGLPKLYAFHVNDSIKGLGSRVDRHRPLGEGLIGIESFHFLMQDPRTRRIPKYLETPGGIDLWKKEIKVLRELAIPPQR
ncbi:MAG: deoxyribonuclease IV [Parachlamydiaceae bacterium]|nr:deoxyribonuclease IV [Parachlamydiaceae bacterium]